jgi:hypothetical protein
MLTIRFRFTTFFTGFLTFQLFPVKFLLRG